MIFEKGITKLQRPLITALMVIACVAFVGLGMYWGYLIADGFFSGELDKGVGILALLNVIPFMLAYVSYRLARKGKRLMQESGMLYSEKT